MSRRPGVQSAQTRASLLKEAAKQFAKYGYAQTSLRSICSAAGVTTGALYFFFENKEDLFRQVIMPVIDSVADILHSQFDYERGLLDAESFADKSQSDQALIEIVGLYRKNKTATRAILANRNHPLVEKAIMQLTNAVDKHMQNMITRIYGEDHGASAFTPFTIHWIAHQKVDMVLHALSKGGKEEQVLSRLRIMAYYLHGGLNELIAQDEARGYLVITDDNRGYIEGLCHLA